MSTLGAVQAQAAAVAADAIVAAAAAAAHRLANYGVAEHRGVVFSGRSM